MHRLLVIAYLVFCANAEAQTFVVSTKRGDVLCGPNGTSWVSGVMKDGVFLSYATKLKSLKRSLKKARGGKRVRLQKSIKSTEAARKRTRKSCTDGPPRDTSGGDMSGAANFDLSGNVTDAGKLLFGIPNDLVGNIARGRTLFQSQCSGCHGDKLGKTFSQYRMLISISPMFFSVSEIPDPSLADLTAYLNRFRQ